MGHVFGRFGGPILQWLSDKMQERKVFLAHSSAFIEPLFNLFAAFLRLQDVIAQLCNPNFFTI